MTFSFSDLWVYASHWIAQTFIIVLGSLVLNVIQKQIFKRLHKRLKGQWYSAVIDALSAPLTLFIWIVSLAFAIQIIEGETGVAIFSAINPIRTVGIVFTLAWFFVRFIHRAKTMLIAVYEKKGEPLDRTTADAVSKVLRASIIVTSCLVGLQSLGFSISGVLAFGGIGGIAIGFAAKDLLSNFFGGLMIYWDRPFKVGDWICSPDREIEGTVETIGWRLTCIRTFQKRLLYVPNSIFANISVENPSRMSHRRIYETIGVRYEDSDRILELLADVRKMLQSHPEIDQSQTLMVNLNAMGNSSLEFFIYTFTRTTVWTKYHEVKEEILMLIYNIITGHGAEVAFPTSTVHLSEHSLAEKVTAHQVRSTLQNVGHTVVPKSVKK